MGLNLELLKKNQFKNISKQNVSTKKTQTNVNLIKIVQLKISTIYTHTISISLKQTYEQKKKLFEKKTNKKK